MGRSFNPSSCGCGQLKVSTVNLGSSQGRPHVILSGLACHCCRNALGWAVTPRRMASLSLSCHYRSLGRLLNKLLLTPCPASCQRGNCSFRGQIGYEERQSDKVEIKSRASPLVAGVSRAEPVSPGPRGGQAPSAPICFIQSRYLPAVHAAHTHSQDWDSSEQLECVAAG